LIPPAPAGTFMMVLLSSTIMNVVLSGVPVVLAE